MTRIEIKKRTVNERGISNSAVTLCLGTCIYNTRRYSEIELSVSKQNNNKKSHSLKYIIKKYKICYSSISSVIGVHKLNEVLTSYMIDEGILESIYKFIRIFKNYYISKTKRDSCYTSIFF